MAEVEKHLFDSMVEYIHGLGRFATDVGSNNLRKASEVKSRLTELTEQSQSFFKLLERKSKNAQSAASAKAMAGFKPRLRKLIKVLTAIRTGVENEELNLTGFRRLVKDQVRPLFKEIADLGKKFSPTGVTDKQLRQEFNYLSITKGHKAALQVYQQAMKEKDSGETESPNTGDDAELAESFRKYTENRSKLPSNLRGRMFQLIKMPIVPYLTQPITPSLLRRTGLKYDYVADSFVVLQDQYLLAFDAEKATEYKGRKRSLQASKSSLAMRKRKSKHQAMHEEFVLDFLERLNASASRKLELVTSHFEYHPHDGRIAFAWVMSASELRNLRRVGESLRTATWGFPWSREASSVL